MKNPFRKKPEGITPGKIYCSEIRSTVFKAKDIAILRECLAGLYKQVPPVLKKKIHDALSHFALSVKGYCQCENKSFVGNENKFACLNCGTRYENKEGGPKLLPSSK